MRGIVFLSALGLAALAGTVVAAETTDAPVPAGRWRCYLPPTYTVTAWFDLEADRTVRVNGGTPAAFTQAGEVLRWPEEALGNRKFGRYFAPGAAGGDARRHTIVLMPRADVKPAARDWARYERCYLTTH